MPPGFRGGIDKNKGSVLSDAGQVVAESDAALLVGVRVATRLRITSRRHQMTWRGQHTGSHGIRAG